MPYTAARALKFDPYTTNVVQGAKRVRASLNDDESSESSSTRHMREASMKPHAPVLMRYLQTPAAQRCLEYYSRGGPIIFLNNLIGFLKF